MAEKKMHGVEDLVTFYKSFFLELPLAGAKWSLGLGDEKAATEAAWKGYDAAVRLSTAAIDNLYRAPMFGEITARSLDGLLRWQRLGNAVAGAFFPILWQTVGLPTAAETQALRAELQGLREELRAQTTGLRVKRKDSGEHPPVATQNDATPPPSRGNGAVASMRVAA